MEVEKDVVSRNRKKELLQKTAKLFAEKGYQACTVQEITQALNISKGGLYWHFKSKEELYIQVCDTYCISSVDTLKDLLGREVLNYDIFYCSFYELLNGYLDDPIQIDLLFDFYAESNRSSIIHEKMREMSLVREEVLVQLLTRLVNERVIAKVDILWLSQVLVSILLGVIVKYRLIPNKESVLREFEILFHKLFQKP